MSKLTTITDRAMELASQAGTSLKHAVPSADKLLQTGAALGVAKTGGKLAVNFVRRNPAVAVATGIGVGLLALVAYRKRKQGQATGAIEGKSRRVEARKVNGKALTFRRLGTSALDQPPASFSGVERIETLGWERGQSDLAFTQEEPMPFHLLSVTRKFTSNDG